MTTNSAQKKALWEAATSGDTSSLPEGFKNIADPNMPKKDGTTLLMTAAQNGHLNVVKDLVRVGADVNQRREDSLTALMLACFVGHLNVVKFLVKHGADINLRYAIESGQGVIKNQTALILSAQRGHLSICKFLVESGADIEAVSDAGYTPLMASMVNGASKPVAKFLLSRGANPNPGAKSHTIHSRSTTPLILAAMNGWSDVVQQLIDMKAEIDATDGFDLMTQSGKCTALKHAVHNNHVPVVEKLLLAGASVDAVDLEGWTPLMNAAVEGSTKLVKLLLQHGANPNFEQKSKDSSSNGETALIKAARNGQVGVVKLLLEAGAKVNADTLTGVSALTAAVEAHGRSDEYQGLGELMSALGLDDSTAKPFSGELRNRSLDVMEILLKNGADVNISIDGVPLHEVLAERNDVDMDKIFEKYGVVTNRETTNSDQTSEAGLETEKFQVIRSRKIEAQIVKATSLKLELIQEINEMILTVPESERQKVEVLLKLLEKSAESFDFKIKEERPDDDDYMVRSKSMIGGPFFTTKKYPRDRGLMPVIQLDLREISRLLGKDLGDGLLQLWYTQGRDFEDVEREKIVIVPRSQITENLLTDWYYTSYDEAEITPISPLPGEMVYFYWYGQSYPIDGVISKGIQCQNKFIDGLVSDLHQVLPSVLIEKITRFSNLCHFEFPGRHLDFVSLLGTFESKSYSNAEVDGDCLVAFHQWGGEYFGYGSSQLFSRPCNFLNPLN